MLEVGQNQGQVEEEADAQGKEEAQEETREIQVASFLRCLFSDD